MCRRRLNIVRGGLADRIAVAMGGQVAVGLQG